MLSIGYHHAGSPRCRHCKRVGKLRRRGLCAECYGQKEVRALYPPKQAPPAGDGDCVHCHLRPGSYRRRLCRPCYSDPRIREQYPAKDLTVYYPPAPLNVEGLALAAVKKLLAALEAPDCDCPPILLCPCGQGCDPARCALLHDTCPGCLALLGMAGSPAGEACALHCPHCREECDCRVDGSAPCPHALGADHDMTIERWGAMLRQADPQSYREHRRSS
jgi:hypothetical protein